MKKVQNHIKKIVFFIICVQIMCVNIPVGLIKNITSKNGICYQNNTESNSQEDSSHNFPINENESFEDNDSFSLKIFLTSSKESKIFNQKELKFLLFDIKNKIQFHPEFTTPPPKHFSA